MTKPLLSLFEKNKTLKKNAFYPPVWLMRQAGRYLPEYRALRKKAGSFLDLCYNSNLAYEITMQPIRRFNFDAAILFSDILVVPHALGFSLDFIPNHGPVLEKFTTNSLTKIEQQSNLFEKALQHLSPSFETLQKLKKNLPTNTTLIGFCGAPWTIATYMIAGEGSKEQIPARLFALQHPEIFKTLLNLLAEISALYLIEQINAGAEIVQIFDSWAGILDKASFKAYCIEPIKIIIEKIKKHYPHIPIIAFPKGASFFYQDFIQQTGIDALSLDWTYPLDTLSLLPKSVILQGNLDPVYLLAGGTALKEQVYKILNAFQDRPFIFNLGHGILPNTPIPHVEALLSYIRHKDTAL